MANAPDDAPGSAGQGLSAAQAAQRLRQDGYNELPSPDSHGLLAILVEVFRQPMFALLIGGGVVYLLLGDRVEALLLLLFATFSATISIVQEARSERVLEALRNLASPRARVVRDGQTMLIAGREVVVGDLLVLAEGDRVAADACLLVAHDLLLDESLLTGESMPVRKQALSADAPADVPAPAPGGDGLSQVFAGSLAVRGSGRARVQATGLRSEMGKIGHALALIETSQPHLQRQVRKLVRFFAIFGAVAGVATVLLDGLLRGNWLKALLGGIALGMSLLPEEFPLVMAVFMAMGAWRISRVRVLTRRAAAIEALGATTVLCTDKTGTLTENRMRVVALASGDACWQTGQADDVPEVHRPVLAAALLACPSEPTDPMDVAVHALAQRQSLPELSGPDFDRVCHRYGLRPELLAMVNVYRTDDGRMVAYAKGALEAIAQLCRLPDVRQAALHRQAEGLAAQGIRVLGVATAEIAPEPDPWPESPGDFIFTEVGLIGFADPLRASVPAAIAECHSAGIRVLMITGDYPATARAIARQAGIAADSVIDGDTLAAMSDAGLVAGVESTSVFARIRPTQKLRIVEHLKAAGEVVAMTGDGVNDAPALKAAHIGIAMGGRGTDVAREAASIVLLDDDFTAIVATVRLGRRIYDNLRKAIEYIVAVHIPIAGLALLPLLLGLPLILTPIHIAFLEMVIDPACSVVFEAEREEADVMRRPPRAAGSVLLDQRRLLWALLQGGVVLTILAALLLVAMAIEMPEAEVRAMAFTALVLANIGLILVNRSFSASWRVALRQPNRALWWLLAGVAVTLSTAVFWPPAQSLFRFAPLDARALSLCVLSGVVSVWLLEAVKSRWFRTGPSVSGPPAQVGESGVL